MRHSSRMWLWMRRCSLLSWRLAALWSHVTEWGAVLCSHEDWLHCGHMWLNEALFSALMKTGCTVVTCDWMRRCSLLSWRLAALWSHVTEWGAVLCSHEDWLHCGHMWLNEALFSALMKTGCTVVTCDSEWGTVLCSHEDWLHCGHMWLWMRHCSLLLRRLCSSRMWLAHVHCSQEDWLHEGWLHFSRMWLTELLLCSWEGGLRLCLMWL